MAEKSGTNILVMCLCLLLAAHVLLLANSRLLPFVDSPHHLAAATIIRFYNDPGNEFSKYYRISLALRPNVFHLLFFSCRLFPSVESAHKVFYALALCAMPLSVLMLILALGGDPLFTVLCFPLFYNFNVVFGFPGFVAAIPLIMLFTVLLVRDTQKPLPRFGLLFSACLLISFFVHVIAALFMGLVYVLHCLQNHYDEKLRLLRRLSVCLPVVALIAFWITTRVNPSETSIPDYLANFYATTPLSVYAGRFAALFFIDGVEILGMAGTALVWLVLAVMCLGFVLTPGARSRALDALGRAGPLLSLAAAAFLCYFFLPPGLPRLGYLSSRFGVIVLITFVVAASLLSSGRYRTMLGLVFMGLALGHLYAAGGWFARFNREMSGLTETFLPEASKGTIVGGMIFRQKMRSVPVFLHTPDYYIVWKRGIAPTHVADCRFSPISKQGGPCELPRYWNRPEDPDYANRYSRLSHILVFGEPEAGVQKQMRQFQEIKRSGDWRLYVRRRGRAKRTETSSSASLR